MRSSSAATKTTTVKRGPGRQPLPRDENGNIIRSEKKSYPNAGSLQVKKKPAKGKYFLYEDPFKSKYLIAREHLDGHIEVLVDFPKEDEPEVSVYDFVRLEKLPLIDENRPHFTKWATDKEAQELINDGHEKGFPDFNPNAIAKAVVVPVTRIFDTVYQVVFNSEGDPAIDFFPGFKGTGNTVETVVRDYLADLEIQWKEAKKVHDQHYADTIKPIVDKMSKHSQILMGRNKK